MRRLSRRPCAWALAEVALGIAQMQIGAQIDPGVPWCHALAEAADGAGPRLALTSGNFGTDDFFGKAFAAQPGGA